MARAVGDWHPFRYVYGRACCGLAGGFLLLRNFSVAISVGPNVCFVNFNSDFYVCSVVHLWAGNSPRGPSDCWSEEPGQNWGRGLVGRGLVEVVVLLLAVVGRFFCFGSLVVLDVVCRYLSIFLFYINIKIGGNRF